MTATDIVERLRQAVDDHDLDSLVACFAPEYRNETPAHPGRGFVGRDQVRTNWQRIFAGLPDVAATVPRVSADGETVWSEWELVGHRPDGVPQAQRGVIIFGVAGDQIAWARFYLEPVDVDDEGIDAAVGRFVRGPDR